MKKQLIRGIIILILFVFSCFLPLIPVQSAPVIRTPHYQLKVVSLFSILWPLRVGVHYRLEWYSLVAVLALLLISVTLGWIIGRKVVR